MKSFSVGIGIVLTMLMSASAARADETYTVRPGDRMHQILRDHGISIGELVDANPGKIRRNCIRPETHVGRNGREYTVCRGVQHWVASGITLVIPTPRSEIVTRVDTFERDLSEVAAERDRLRAELRSEQRARSRAERELTWARADNNALTAKVATLSSEVGDSVSTAAFVIVVIALILALGLGLGIPVGLLSRKSNRLSAEVAGLKTEISADEENRRKAAAALANREKTIQAREKELDGLLEKARKDLGEAGRQSQEIEVDRHSLEDVRQQLADQQKRAAGAERAYKERMRELDARDEKLSERQRQLEESLEELQKAAKPKPRFQTQPITGEQARIAAAEGGLEPGPVPETEGLPDLTGKLDLEEAENPIEREETKIVRNPLAAVPPPPPPDAIPLPAAAVVRAEVATGVNNVHPVDTVEVDGSLPRPTGADPVEVRCLECGAVIAAELREIHENVHEQEQEFPDGGERPAFRGFAIATVRCRECQATVRYDDLAAHSKLHEDADEPSRRVRKRRATQRGLGDNGSGERETPADRSDEEVTAKVETHGFHDFEPEVETRNDSGELRLICSCDNRERAKEEHEDHMLKGHIRCTLCNPPVVIVATNRRRHIERHHPELLIDQEVRRALSKGTSGE